MLIGLLVGIRFETVEEFLRDNTEESNEPTISVPIHFLHDDHTLIEWDADEATTISALLKEVEVYAMPFFKHYENLEKLLSALQSEDPRQWLSVSKNARVELVAGILAVLGRHSEARNWIEREIEARRSKPSGHRAGLERIRRKLAA
jgi:predicted house-cleaning noncanonical NTP pyrophosphatase (MazG superfamily)